MTHIVQYVDKHKHTFTLYFCNETDALEECAKIRKKGYEPVMVVRK